MNDGVRDGPGSRLRVRTDRDFRGFVVTSPDTQTGVHPKARPTHDGNGTGPSQNPAGDGRVEGRRCGRRRYRGRQRFRDDSDTRPRSDWCPGGAGGLGGPHVRKRRPLGRPVDTPTEYGTRADGRRFAVVRPRRVGPEGPVVRHARRPRDQTEDPKSKRKSGRSGIPCTPVHIYGNTDDLDLHPRRP